jgi:hypothetical protein
MLLFLGGMKMKTLNQRKVREIAIDMPNQSQIYIADPNNQSLVIQTLMDLGYEGDLTEIKKQPDHLPVVVDTLEKVFFVIPIGLMACAAQCGAQAINYQKMLDLIE